MKIGVNLFSIRNLIQTKESLIKTLKALKKDHCDFVQFSGSPVPLKALKEVSKVTKMPIVITHAPYSRMVNDLDNLMKEHKSFNCSRIGLSRIDDMKIYPDDKKVKAEIDRLEKIAIKMNKKGFKFFFHNHNFEFRKMKDGETIFDYLIKKAPHINFILDIYWVQYSGANIIDMIRRLKGRVECIHLKDYKINDELNPEIAPLGDGNIDLEAVIKEAKKAGTKYFLIEQDNAADKKNGYQDIVKSIKYIKENF